MNILLTVVCLNYNPQSQLRLLVDTAKKKFLTNHNVDIVIVSDKPVEYPGTTNTVIDNFDMYNGNINYFQLYKILALNYINLDKYDYAFVSDADQMFINDVTDNDLLVNKLCILSHYWDNLYTCDGLREWSDIITIDNKQAKHTMGNFYGGPIPVIKDLLLFVSNYWPKYREHIHVPVGFFCKYPEEVLLVKYIYDNNLSEHRLSSSMNYATPAFLTNIDFSNTLLDYKNNFKLIHNTKADMDTSEKLYKITCE